MIKHFPKLDTRLVEEVYSRKDEETCKYVCTTELTPYGRVYDIFYRPTAHPRFGNYYFGLGSGYITNADKVEELTFACIGDKEGDFTYSQYTHDFLNWGDGFIDGGRSYTRVGGVHLPKVIYYKVKNGEFIESNQD